MKQVVLRLTHTAEVILDSSVVTKNRPLKFKLLVLAICTADIAVMVYCIINLMK